MLQFHLFRDGNLRTSTKSRTYAIRLSNQQPETLYLPMIGGRNDVSDHVRNRRIDLLKDALRSGRGDSRKVTITQANSILTLRTIVKS